MPERIKPAINRNAINGWNYMKIPLFQTILINSSHLLAGNLLSMIVAYRSTERSNGLVNPIESTQNGLNLEQPFEISKNLAIFSIKKEIRFLYNPI